MFRVLLDVWSEKLAKLESKGSVAPMAMDSMAPITSAAFLETLQRSSCLPKQSLGDDAANFEVFVKHPS